MMYINIMSPSVGQTGWNHMMALANDYAIPLMGNHPWALAKEQYGTINPQGILGNLAS